MKNLNIFSIGVVLVLILSLFTSCDKEEFENIVPIDEITTNPDTITISEELLYRVEGEQEEIFNGISINCPNPDSENDNYINVIAYGKDLVVSEDGESATYTDNLFIFFWETENELTPGTYQSLVSIETESDYIKETFAEVTIIEATESFTYGTFSGKYLSDDQESVIHFSGSFQVRRYDCSIFGEGIPEGEDFDPEISFGSTILDFSMGEQESLSSMYLNCSEVFPEVEGDKHFQFLAEAVLTDGTDFDGILKARFFSYHRELQDLELNREYDARFGSIGMDEDMSETFTMGEEHVISITQPITIIYTDIDELFVTGEYYGQYMGLELKGTFRSQMFECD